MSYDEAKSIIEEWLTSGDLKNKEWINVMKLCLSLINEKIINSNEK